MTTIENAIVKDPVCGMTVDPARAKFASRYRDADYWFCSAGCKAKFDADAERYLALAKSKAQAAAHLSALSEESNADPSTAFAARTPVGMTLSQLKAEESAPPGTQYTCPMHPEIVRDGPGDCPICGMALEPMTVTLDADAANPELKTMTRKLWLSAAATLPLLLIMLQNYFQRTRLSACCLDVRWAWLSFCWRRLWCCGAGGRSFSADGLRCAAAI